MASKGLNEDARNYVASLVEGKKSGDYVRDAIRHRLRSTDWDYDKNVRFLSWLRGQGYEKSAEFLARHMDG